MDLSWFLSLFNNLVFLYLLVEIGCTWCWQGSFLCFLSEGWFLIITWSGWIITWCWWNTQSEWITTFIWNTWWDWNDWYGVRVGSFRWWDTNGIIVLVWIFFVNSTGFYDNFFRCTVLWFVVLKDFICLCSHWALAWGSGFLRCVGHWLLIVLNVGERWKSS